MPSIRKTKTGSGSIAVQIVRYENRKVVILKHIGSGRSPEEVSALIENARVWIEQKTKQASLFPKKQARTLPLATSQYVGVTHTFIHDALSQIAKQCGFDTKKDAFLLDFAFMRLIEPVSKLRSITLLERYFGIQYAKRSVYRALPRLKERKKDIEDIAVACALNDMKSGLAMVLYDVTTLYFETFKSDDLRIQGFSKDNKSQQPQIVVGLLVTKEGFPLGYEVFAGNTFEGDTMLPVLEAFAEKHNVTTPTVVADAAMLSFKNIKELESRHMSYIVGARMANCSSKVIKEASDNLNQTDGKITRLQTAHGDLVVSFSAKRFRKNKADMDKQILKGKALVERKEPGRRAKFVKRADQEDAYVLNEALIEKNTMLLGIKGYYTNIPEKQLSNQKVLARYYDLWHVEQAFRMAKSDLATRPIFHYKEDAVRAHMLICFASLVIGKYLEIKTGQSLKRVIDILWSVTYAKIINTATKEVFSLCSPISDEVRELMKVLRLSY